jgi:hypothetical protein
MSTKKVGFAESHASTHVGHRISSGRVRPSKEKLQQEEEEGEEEEGEEEEEAAAVARPLWQTVVREGPCAFFPRASLL